MLRLDWNIMKFFVNFSKTEKHTCVPFEEYIFFITKKAEDVEKYYLRHWVLAQRNIRRSKNERPNFHKKKVIRRSKKQKKTRNVMHLTVASSFPEIRKTH